MEVAALGLKVEGADGIDRAASALDHLTKSSDSAEKSVDGLSREASKAKKPLEDVAKSSGDASSGVSSLASVAAKAGAIIGAAFSINAVARYADAWSDMTSLVRVNIGAQENAADVMTRLSSIARMTYSSMEATSRSFATNAFTLNALGKTTQQQLDYTEALNNALVVSGAKGQQFEMVQNSLNRAMAQGSLRGIELQNVLNYGSEVAGLLANELGVNVTELRALAAQGKITGEVIYSALTGNMELVREKAESMPATIGDAFVLIRNSVLMTVGVFDQQNQISETLATTLIAVADNMQGVVSILAGAAAAWVTYGVAVNGAALATRAATAAQLLFNAAAMMNPYVAIATVIAGVGVALYGMRDRLIEIGGATATLGDYARATWNEIASAVSGVRDFISGVWSEIQEELRAASDFVSSVWQSMTGGFEGAADEISKASDWLWNGLIDSAIAWSNRIITLFVGIPTTVWIVGRAIVDAFKNSFQAALNLATAFGKDLRSILAGDFSFNNFEKALRTNLLDPTKKVTKEVSDHWEKNMGRNWLGEAEEGLIEFGKRVVETAGELSDARKSTDELAEAAGGLGDKLKEISPELQKILDRLHPGRQATRELQAEYRLLTQALQDNLIAQQDLDKWIEQNALKEVIVTAKRHVKDLKEAADPFADAWKTAMERVDSAFADAWKGAFDSFNDFARGIKNAFRQLLAEMAHAAITRPILISLGLVGGSSGAMAGVGGAGGAASILSNLSALAGGSLSGMYQGIGTGLSNLGLTGLGDKAYNAGLAHAGLGGAALGIGGGLLGGYLGNQVFGKTSGAGAALGGIAGGMLIPIPGLGTAIGSFLGSGLESLFGSSSNKFASQTMNFGTGASAQRGSGGSLEGSQNLMSQLAQFVDIIGGSSAAIEIGHGRKTGFELRTGSAAGGRSQSQKFKTEAEIIAAALDEILKNAQSLTPAVRDLSRAFGGSLEQTAAYAVALQNLWDLAQDNPVQRAARDLEMAGKTAYGVFEDQQRALRELAQSFDGSYDATIALSQALANTNALSYQLTHIFDQVGQQVNTIFGGLRESIRTSLMTQEELYEYQRGQVHSLTDLIGTMTDPERILSATQQIEQLVNSMWGGLDAAQREIMGPEFLQYLDQAQDLAQNRLNEGIEALELAQLRNSEMVQQGIQSAADALASSAASYQLSAQQMQQAAAMFMESAVALASGRRAEVNA